MSDQTPIERLAEELAYLRYPDQTVQDEPDLIDLMVPDARAALTAALGSVEETARVIDAHLPEWQTWRNGDLKQVWCSGCQAALPEDTDASRHQAEALHAHLLAEPETNRKGQAS